MGVYCVGFEVHLTASSLAPRKGAESVRALASARRRLGCPRTAWVDDASGRCEQMWCTIAEKGAEDA